MEAIDMDKLKAKTSVGIRAKGSTIFYSCTVLSVDQNKINLSIPLFRDPAIKSNTKIQIRVLDNTGEYGGTLYSGTVGDNFVSYLDVLITSQSPFEEKRKSFRVPNAL
ncbi:MAG: hypothetical protein ACYDEQ_03270, partial [Desulfocucumaceae bacterium]